MAEPRKKNDASADPPASGREHPVPPERATIDPSESGETTDGFNVARRESISVPETSQEGATVDPATAEPATVDPFDQSYSGPTLDPSPASASSSDVDSTDFTLNVPKKKKKEVPKLPGYDILGELGRGGMGVVYKARQKGLNRLVALKMVLAGGHAGPEQLSRFQLEATAVAALQHPSIVQIYEVSQQDGLPYFSLEYVDGDSLQNKIGGKPLPNQEAAVLSQLLALAMSYAHSQGIIHRDLKPANVLLTSDGVPKITDFGLAKQLESDSSQTRSGTIMGTPSYMAPEQARGEIRSIGPRTDIYSLGAILYEMLTGRPPFVGATLLETIQQVERDEPVPPSQLQPSLPRDLETICLKCLQKDPQKRYPRAEILADDLSHFLKGEPILARPVSSPERFYRWCKRNPRIASLAGAILFLLVLIAATSTTLALKINQEKAEKEVERQSAVAARVFADQKAADEAIARKQADENAKIAAEQSNLALNTLNGLAIEVQGQLKDRADLDDLRQKLLQYALAGMDGVAKKSADSPLAQRTKGGIFQRKGDILLRAGRTKDAVEQFKQALSILENLVEKVPRDDPESELAHWNAAVLNERMGEYVPQLDGNAASAGDYLQRALMLRESLAAKGTFRSEKLNLAMVQEALAGTYTKQGNLSNQLGDPAGARSHHRRALEVREKLWKAQPENSSVKQNLAASFLALADVSFRLGDAAGARDYYDRAIRFQREFAVQNPQSVTAKRNLAASYGALGDLELQTGNSQTALLTYRKSHEAYEQVRKLDPRNAEYLSDISQSFYRLGTVNLRLGDGKTAQNDFQECLKLREAQAAADPGNSYKQLGAMLAQARCGFHEKASQQADQLRKAKSNEQDILYYVACTYALCVPAVSHGKTKGVNDTRELALKQSYADRAIETLAGAIKRGYHDLVALQSDPDLDPVRDRPRFNDLIAKLKPK